MRGLRSFATVVAALGLHALPVGAAEVVQANRIVIVSDDISNQTINVEHSPVSPEVRDGLGGKASAGSILGTATGSATAGSAFPAPSITAPTARPAPSVTPTRTGSSDGSGPAGARATPAKQQKAKKDKKKKERKEKASKKKAKKDKKKKDKKKKKASKKKASKKKARGRR